MLSVAQGLPLALSLLSGTFRSPLGTARCRWPLGRRCAFVAVGGRLAAAALRSLSVASGTPLDGCAEPTLPVPFVVPL